MTQIKLQILSRFAIEISDSVQRWIFDMLVRWIRWLMLWYLYTKCVQNWNQLYFISFEHYLMVTGERKIDIALWVIFIQSHNVQHLILLWDRNISFQNCTHSITISISRYRHLFLIICAAFILSYTCGSNRLWNQLVLNCFMITSWDKN